MSLAASAGLALFPRFRVDPRRVLVDGSPAVGPYAGYMLQMFVTLLAVCVLAFVVLFGARRLGVGRPRGPIELVGLLPLDARRSIYLVKVAGQVIVVGASEAGFTKLGEMAAGDLPTQETAEPNAFSEVLARVLGREKSAKGGRDGGASS